jgi:hypothetical protein
MLCTWYILSLNLVSLFTEIDSEFIGIDPSGGIIIIILWIFLSLWLYSLVSALWELLAILGFYITPTDFVKVLSYPFYLKVEKQPLSRVVTIEIVKNPDSNHHMLKVVYCITKRQDLSLMTWFNHSVSVIPQRYKYYAEEQGESQSFIWGEDIDTEGNKTLGELQAIAQQGKELLAKYTNHPIEFFHPELHCPNCKTLNDLEDGYCKNCGSEIDHDIANVPTFD